MSSYAILGATGNVGMNLLRLLLQDSRNEINVYVRSKSKLIDAQPRVKEHLQVKVFEGDLQNVGLIKDCISTTRAVFMAVALSENLPGCTIAMDTARVVAEALEQLRSERESHASYTTPSSTQIVIFMLTSKRLKAIFVPRGTGPCLFL